MNKTIQDMNNYFRMRELKEFLLRARKDTHPVQPTQFGTPSRAKGLMTFLLLAAA